VVQGQLEHCPSSVAKSVSSPNAPVSVAQAVQKPAKSMNIVWTQLGVYCVSSQRTSKLSATIPTGATIQKK